MKKIIIFILFMLLGVNVHSNNLDTLFSIATKKILEFKPKRKDYFILIDFNKSINENRLYLLDMRTKTIVINCKVGHSKKSGLLYANDFSNLVGSNKSCLGVFQTKNTYYGGLGYSMVIEGLEKGINNNCERRKIIFHSNQKTGPYLWSHGCFVTESIYNRIIIDMTKNGVLIYVYQKIIN